ncbi:hypothetical protein D3C80_2136700 [compost metagenome]
MAETRDHQHNLHPFGLVMQSHLHAELFRDRRKPGHKVLSPGALLGNEPHPHEEAARTKIVELRTIDDVAAFFSEKA